MSKKETVVEEIKDEAIVEESTEIVNTEQPKKKVNVKAIAKMVGGGLLILASGVITGALLIGTGKSSDSNTGSDSAANGSDDGNSES